MMTAFHVFYIHSLLILNDKSVAFYSVDNDNDRSEASYKTFHSYLEVSKNQKIFEIKHSGSHFMNIKFED